MTRAATWTNSDGLSVGYGRLTSRNKNAGTVRTMGNEEMLVMEIAYDAMPLASGTARTSKDTPIPAGSYITKATLNVLSTFADADANPTMTIGLVNSAGTAIDVDGLFAGLTEASVQLVAPQVVEGDVATYGGALVNGIDHIGAADGYVNVDLDTGAWDSGLAQLTVWYIRPTPDSTPTEPLDSIQGTL